MNQNEMNEINKLPIPLNPESFFRSFIVELSCLLNDLYGIDTTAKIIQTTTQNVSTTIIQMYQDALETSQFSNQQVVEIVQDVMNRINGDFYLEKNTIPVILIKNQRCPFGNEVKRNPALCMITKEIHQSFFKETELEVSININQSIAEGASNCFIEIQKETINKE